MNEHDFYFQEIQKSIDLHLKKLVPTTVAEKLKQAIFYSLLSGGKRIRAQIVVALCDLFKVPRDFSLKVACAIEILHCYSLVHDDLPCMDDDDYRRGQLSCHRKFNEATAILAGDALLTLAFEILSQESTAKDPATRVQLINILACNSGINGIVGGQALDIESLNDNNLSLAKLNNIHLMKTAKLFIACTHMSGILAAETNKDNKDYLETLEQFGLNFGLGYQIFDDLIDAELDKKDMLNNLVILLGQEKCLDSLQKYRDQAILNLKKIGIGIESLQFLVENNLNL